MSHLPGEGVHDGTTALLIATHTNIATATVIMRMSHKGITMSDDNKFIRYTEKKTQKVIVIIFIPVG